MTMQRERFRVNSWVNVDTQDQAVIEVWFDPKSHYGADSFNVYVRGIIVEQFSISPTAIEKDYAIVYSNASKTACQVGLMLSKNVAMLETLHRQKANRSTP